MSRISNLENILDALDDQIFAHKHIYGEMPQAIFLGDSMCGLLERGKYSKRERGKGESYRGIPIVPVGRNIISVGHAIEYDFSTGVFA